MKTKSVILLLPAILLLAACEHPMTFETDVREDGGLTKTMTFEKEDSTSTAKNIFGIDSAKGWSVEAVQLPVDKDKEMGRSKVQYRIQFKKDFGSADEMNKDLNPSSDSLFRIRSTFERKFRWFYTYIKYTETFLPVNRFIKISPEDYLNQEDNQFIDRLPAEGQTISKADSLYLQALNVKIGETFANMAIFSEQFEIMNEIVKRNNIDKKWLDVLANKREFIYDHIDKMKGERDFALQMFDSLHIPLDPTKAAADSRELSKDLNGRVSFMGFANDGKYVNIIHMPWTVVSTNADSVSGNTLIWRPLVTKFLFREYEMYAEARRLNTWALLISIGVVLLTLFLWRRGKF